MSLTLTPSMHTELDKFFAGKVIGDVDRNTFLVCNLFDPRLKIHFSLIFLRDLHSLESDDFGSIAIQEKGYVLTFPCYWVSVPKELCMTYMEYLINNLYETEICNWECYETYMENSGTASSGNSGNSNSGNNTTATCPPGTPGFQPQYCPVITNNI